MPLNIESYFISTLRYFPIYFIFSKHSPEVIPYSIFIILIEMEIQLYKEIMTLLKGFEQSEHVIEGEVHIGGQEHFYLETNVTLAVPKNEDGEMELFVSTQNPTETQVRTFIVFLY
jgi:hypothetical protein